MRESVLIRVSSIHSPAHVKTFDDNGVPIDVRERQQQQTNKQTQKEFLGPEVYRNAFLRKQGKQSISFGEIGGFHMTSLKFKPATKTIDLLRFYFHSV